MTIPYPIYIYCLIGLILSYEKIPLFHYFRWCLVFLLGFLIVEAWQITLNREELLTVITGDPIMVLGFMSLYVFAPVMMLMPFLSKTIGTIFDAAHIWLLSLYDIKGVKTYDRAEKAEHEKKYLEAIMWYRKYAVKYPEDPEPWRRIGEIYILQEEYNRAIQSLEEAFNRIIDDENKLIIGFRIADVMAQKLEMPEKSRDYLSSLSQKIQDSKYTQLIEDRLKTIS